MHTQSRRRANRTQNESLVILVQILSLNKNNGFTAVGHGSYSWGGHGLLLIACDGDQHPIRPGGCIVSQQDCQIPASSILGVSEGECNGATKGPSLGPVLGLPLGNELGLVLGAVLGGSWLTVGCVLCMSEGKCDGATKGPSLRPALRLPLGNKLRLLLGTVLSSWLTVGCVLCMSKGKCDGAAKGPSLGLVLGLPLGSALGLVFRATILLGSWLTVGVCGACPRETVMVLPLKGLH